MKAVRSIPKVLTVEQVQAILDGCEHLRDRLLFALMLDSGVRVSEALGLRHEDFAIAEKTVTVTPAPLRAVASRCACAFVSGCSATCRMKNGGMPLPAETCVTAE